MKGMDHNLQVLQLIIIACQVSSSLGLCNLLMRISSGYRCGSQKLRQHIVMSLHSYYGHMELEPGTIFHAILFFQHTNLRSAKTNSRSALGQSVGHDS